jgi:hypothetical protein
VIGHFGQAGHLEQVSSLQVGDLLITPCDRCYVPQVVPVRVVRRVTTDAQLTC